VYKRTHSIKQAFYIKTNHEREKYDDLGRRALSGQGPLRWFSLQKRKIWGKSKLGRRPNRISSASKVGRKVIRYGFLAGEKNPNGVRKYPHRRGSMSNVDGSIWETGPNGGGKSSISTRDVSGGGEKGWELRWKRSQQPKFRRKEELRDNQNRKTRKRREGVRGIKYGHTRAIGG